MRSGNDRITRVDFGGMSEACGLALLRKKYHPIPIPKGTKAPNIKGWPQYGQKGLTSHQIKKWSQQNTGCGWGIICGHSVVGIDIDEEHKKTAVFLQQLAFQILGPTAVRFGRYPRRMLVYRVVGNSIKSSKSGVV